VGVACALLGSAATLAVIRARSTAPVSTSVAATPAPPLVRFSVDAPTATSVHVVGDFNGWDPAALPLRRSADGRTWEVEIPLTPGRYSYSFLIDGTLARDPRAARAVDDDFGSPNSVVLVTGT
jgi:1,4-alpha-glucan branching enzyme